MAETPPAEPEHPHPSIDRGADSASQSHTAAHDRAHTPDSGLEGPSSAIAGPSALCANPETICPICQRRFVATGARQWCSPACKTEAWRRANPVTQPPTGRRPQLITVYACRSCGARDLQRRQRCAHCGGLMRNLGIGGPCPQCATLITVAELLHEEVMPQR